MRTSCGITLLDFDDDDADDADDDDDKGRADVIATSLSLMMAGSMTSLIGIIARAMRRSYDDVMVMR